MKNVGRAVAGADLKPVREAEGKFQSAVLAPMRTSHKLLFNLNNATLAAIGGVERLEQSAEAGRKSPLCVRSCRRSRRKPPPDPPPRRKNRQKRKRPHYEGQGISLAG